MPNLPSNLPQYLRSRGLTVVEEPGWTTRKRPGSFSPKGVILHHTAIDSDSASVRVVRDGRSDLPGPLSQFVLLKTGVVVIIAAGRSNHAGAGSWKGTTEGNTYFAGIEAVNKGDGTPWPQVQLDAYYKLAAALAALLKFTTEWVIGHREWAPSRKIDPRGIDLNDFRSKVANLLVPSNIVVGQPLEVDVLLTPVQLNIPLDSVGRGWLRVPYQIDKVVGLKGHSGTRPGVDGAYDGAPDEVGITPDDNSSGVGSIIVVQGGNPGGSAPVYFHVIQ